MSQGAFGQTRSCKYVKSKKKKKKRKQTNKRMQKKQEQQKTKKTSKLAITTDLHSAVCKMDGSAGESKRGL